MNAARPAAAVAAAFAVGMILGCGPKRIPTPATPGQSVIALLPDPESGTTGRAVVSNPGGIVDLTSARDSTTVTLNQPPTPVAVLSEADVNRLFGDALTALPVAPEHFVLYFRFESNELTDASLALLPKVLDAVKQHPFPDVAVVGHTDTTGASSVNFELGLRRATAIRGRLIEAGIASSMIEVTSHGEADLLIKTADDVAEPRNRRVEITVR
jgi:outer membrane protein OmpA-like peptidoglycan-associated protein